jgi:GTPase SAR1 family protein
VIPCFMHVGCLLDCRSLLAETIAGGWVFLLLFSCRSDSQSSVRILVVGDSGVGKTALVSMLCTGEVVKASPDWTIGCNVEVMVCACVLFVTIALLLSCSALHLLFAQSGQD